MAFYRSKAVGYFCFFPVASESQQRLSIFSILFVDIGYSSYVLHGRSLIFDSICSSSCGSPAKRTSCGSFYSEQKTTRNYLQTQSDWHSVKKKTQNTKQMIRLKSLNPITFSDWFTNLSVIKMKFINTL